VARQFDFEFPAQVAKLEITLIKKGLPLNAHLWCLGCSMSEAIPATVAVGEVGQPDPRYFDLGHQGDFDRTQIAARLAMTPTERLRHHETWRLFVKEALNRAELRRKAPHRPS
jgi:hypothetical protein